MDVGRGQSPALVWSAGQTPSLLVLSCPVKAVGSKAIFLRKSQNPRVRTHTVSWIMVCLTVELTHLRSLLPPGPRDDHLRLSRPWQHGLTSCPLQPSQHRLLPVLATPACLPPHPRGFRSLRGKLGPLCITDSSGTPGRRDALSAGEVSEQWSRQCCTFKMPAEGTVCYSA